MASAAASLRSSEKFFVLSNTLFSDILFVRTRTHHIQQLDSSSCILATTPSKDNTIGEW